MPPRHCIEFPTVAAPIRPAIVEFEFSDAATAPKPDRGTSRPAPSVGVVAVLWITLLVYATFVRCGCTVTDGSGIAFQFHALGTTVGAAGVGDRAVLPALAVGRLRNVSEDER